jgi:hypothetical protein
LGKNSWPTIASSTELFPLLWLPMTTMLGRRIASFLSMLSSMFRISIIVFVRFMNLLLSGSPLPNMSSGDVAPVGAATAAPSNAASAASSGGGRPPLLPPSLPPALALASPLASAPAPAPRRPEPEKRSRRN